MSYEMVYFNTIQEIFQERGMESVVQQSLDYIDIVIYEGYLRGYFLKNALEDLGWRDTQDLIIIPGRRYRYKGLLNGIAIEASLYCYEGLWEALFRLQLGYDKGQILGGIVVLTGERSPKSPMGNTLELVQEEMAFLYPTINLPVSVAVFKFEINRNLEYQEPQSVEQ